MAERTGKALVRTSSLLGSVFILALLSACGTLDSYMTEYLDETTGVTITRSNVPLVLYRDNPALAAYARSYAHIGPIEINRSGTYQYFLWVGLWNTMQTVDSPKQRDGFGSITIFADGEPLLLELAGWTPEAIGASLPVYLKPVSSAADAYYRVTADQVRLVAEASEIRLRTSGAAPKEYLLWDNQQSARKSFAAFLEHAFL